VNEPRLTRQTTMEQNGVSKILEWKKLKSLV
jgi:hypothetical protein